MASGREAFLGRSGFSRSSPFSRDSMSSVESSPEANSTSLHDGKPGVMKFGRPAGGLACHRARTGKESGSASAGCQRYRRPAHRHTLALLLSSSCSESIVRSDAVYNPPRHLYSR
jgi:hypothetical protein